MRLRRLVWVFCLTCAVASPLWPQDRRPVVFEFGAAAGVPFKDVFGTQPVFSGTQTSTESSSPPKIVAGPIIDAVLYHRALIEFGALYRPAEFDSEIVQLG